MPTDIFTDELAARRDRFAQRLAENLAQRAADLMAEKNLATFRDAMDLLLATVPR